MTLENKRRVLQFLLDLSAAFDTVDHTLLFACMISAGVIGVAHKWFESYLTSMTQIVRLGQTQSDPVGAAPGSDTVVCYCPRFVYTLHGTHWADS